MSVTLTTGVVAGTWLAEDGTIAAPSYSFANQSMGFYRNTVNQLTLSVAAINQYTFDASLAHIRLRGGSGALSWASTDDSTVAADTFILRDAANTLAQRNGVNAQAFRIYNTFTDVNNYERITISGPNIFTQNAGTGLARSLGLGTQGTVNWFLGGSTGHLQAQLDNTYDIGASGANRPRNIFVAGNVYLTAPVTNTGATYTVLATDNYLIANAAATQTLTLPAPASNTGRTIRVKTIAAFTVVSASANVVPLAGGAAGTAILAATAGKWADLTSDGTNWVIMAGN